ncbi:60S ribosomal export protein NMD3 [Bienertia sinuspersici]
MEVSSSITLMDPKRSRHCYLHGDQYWRSLCSCLLSSRQLVDYIDDVLDVVNVAGSRGVDQDEVENENEEFLKEIEENTDLLSNMILHQNEEYQALESASLTDDCEKVPDELVADVDCSEDENED